VQFAEDYSRSQAPAWERTAPRSSASPHAKLELCRHGIPKQELGNEREREGREGREDLASSSSLSLNGIRPFAPLPLWEGLGEGEPSGYAMRLLAPTYEYIGSGVQVGDADLHQERERERGDQRGESAEPERERHIGRVGEYQKGGDQAEIGH